VEKKEIKPEDVPEIKEIVKPAHVVLPDLDTEMGEVKPPGDE